MKLKIVASENKTNTSECWNNYSGDKVAEFIRNNRPRFVDVVTPDGKVWEWMGNEEDTLVFVVNGHPSWDYVDQINYLNPDEFTVENIDGTYVARLWWD